MAASLMPEQPKVLLVDFEPRNVRKMLEKLTKAGYEVEVAWDGLEALDIFEQRRPDAVLLEAMLPKMHGFDVCRKLKRELGGHGTPVVITTSVYRGRNYRNMALHEIGCDEYLERPFDDATLMKVLARVAPVGRDN